MKRFATFLLLILSAGGGGCATCRNDWVIFEESCYVFVDEYVSWSTANQICQSIKSRLLEVNTRAENDFIASQLKSRQLTSTWNGINDFVREGTWVIASDQQPATYFNWNSGEPNNSGSHSEGGEDCVIVYNSGVWDDYWCDDTHHSVAVCESPSEEDEVVG